MLRRCLLASTVLAASPALAQQGWNPAGPVRLVVPFPPGGSIDLVARLLASAAQRDFRQAVVVENRPGAGTLVATDAMRHTAPDGLAALMVANSFTINPSLHRPAPYEPLRHFTPLALLTETPHVLVARPGLAPDFAAFVARARQPGAGLSFGSPGQGTSHHLGAEQLKLLAGLNATHVPYRVTAQAMTDLIAGRVDYLYGNLPDVLPSIRDGKVQALGVAAPHRSALLPDLPTLGELGYPTAISDSWFGIVMPAGGRPEVIQRHVEVWLAALRQPEAEAKLREQGYEILGQGPEALTERIRRDLAVYSEVIARAQLKPE